MEEQVGRKARCRAPGSRRGGCHREGAEESAPFTWRPKPAAIHHVWGGAGNGGLAAGCPQPEEPSPSARRRRSVRPSTKDVQYHRMAPRVRAAQLVEDRAAVCPGTGPRYFFSALVSVTPHSSVSFSLASSVLTPRYAAAALTGPPGRGGGGSRAQSRVYPPACEGRWGYVMSGAELRAVGMERGRWSK